LALVDSNTTITGDATPDFTNLAFKFGGNSSANKGIGTKASNKIDDLKVWDTAVTP
jgi:hypothetical protein